jgi:hypothetical protein
MRVEHRRESPQQWEAGRRRPSPDKAEVPPSCGDSIAEEDTVHTWAEAGDRHKWEVREARTSWAPSHRDAVAACTRAPTREAQRVLPRLIQATPCELRLDARLPHPGSSLRAASSVSKTL